MTYRMSFVFDLSCPWRHFVVVRAQVIVEIFLCINIAHNLPKAHGVNAARIAILQRANTQAVTQQQLLVEGC